MEAGDRQSGFVAKVQLSGVTRTIAVSQEGQPQQVRVELPLGRTDKGKPDCDTPNGAPNESRRNQFGKRAASLPAPPVKAGDPGSPAADGSATPHKWRIAVGAVNAVRSFGSSTPPPARLALGANQPHPPTPSASSPTGSVIGARIDWAPRGSPTMRISGPRGALQQEDARSERSCSHSSIPAAGRATQNLSNRVLPTRRTAQREDCGLAVDLQRVGAFRNSERGLDRHEGMLSVGTAGALLDRVANKSLKPLSHVKITNAAGKPVAQPYQNRDSTSSFENSTRGSSATDSASRIHSAGSSTDGDIKGNALLPGSQDEDIQMNDDGGEPDSKMYRTMKQRVAELGDRIMQLRRQGDTAHTAAEILSRKQEQRRADMTAAVDADEALQNALLDHGDAMVRMKETESVFCLRQAGFLEEEMVACRDALQYAVADWHYRREMKRLDERCATLRERAQSQADEARRFDAEATDAAEYVILATSKANRGGRVYAATLEEQQMRRFIDEQQEWLRVARLRTAESRSEAVQTINLEKGVVKLRLLSEKKALCNKVLYQSAVEMADVYDHAAKIIAKAQHVRWNGVKATADAFADRVQQLEAEVAAHQVQHTKSSAGPTTSMLRRSRPASVHTTDALGAIKRLSAEVEEAIQQCLQEITGETSDVLSVHRRHTEQICALARLYQTSYDCDDHMLDEAKACNEEAAKLQPPSEAAKRVACITAAQDAVQDLDRACGIAAQLRALSLDAAEAHAELFSLRGGPETIRAQLQGEKIAGHETDREELDTRKQRLAILEIEIPLARDQLTAAIQVVEYRQAAAQLMEAQKELQYTASVAAGIVTNLESMIAIRREHVAIMHHHINAVLHEARVFTANGNVLHAAAAEEAAQRLAKESLSAEASLEALIKESQLKRDEEFLAGAAAEELQQVGDGSLELVGLLIRIVSLQEELRVVSLRINELDSEQSRLKQESASRLSLAAYAYKQAELSQHEFLQCRTNLKFSAADAHLNESRQCRFSAQEHANAADAAKQAASAAARQHKSACQRRKQLFREVHLLHTAAGHLQGALSCMRDKHHLVRKLRDIEYQRRNERQSGDQLIGSSSLSPVQEIDVLQTQVNASTATVKHHLASKISYVMAADNLHLARASLQRQTACASEADAAMQDIIKARVAAATAGTRRSVPTPVSLLVADEGGPGEDVATPVQATSLSTLALVQRSKHEEEMNLPALWGGASLVAESKTASLQLQQAELRYRCLHGSLTALETIAAAAERASEARCWQVDLSDQAAVLVSDLAAKILEAEACANEAASLEASVRANAALLDEDDEENVKVKLMLNALLQKAESYRNEALLLQGRIKELEEQERAADAKAVRMEESLVCLQDDHRHALDALDLAERISQSREQEATVREQIQTLAAEVAQLEREAKSMENKTAQLRQQLTNASHTACSEDVANVMLVMQQIDRKLALHLQVLQQRKLELESCQEAYERLSTEIALMKHCTEHVLRASETQEHIRQGAVRVAELQSDALSAQAARSQCDRTLDELRQQYVRLGAAERDNASSCETQTLASRSDTARQSQQMAATQAAIAFAEQMLETHSQRLEVLRAAVAAWEAAKQRQEALLRHQEQLMQQDSWRASLEQHRAELRKATMRHAEKAKQLREGADKCNSGAALLQTAGTDPIIAERLNDISPGAEAVLSTVRVQAAVIRAATDTAEQHARAEAEGVLAGRAADLAQSIDHEISCFSAASDLVQPMIGRLHLAASAAVSVARLQLVCVGICSDQGRELSSMHDALTGLKEVAAKIQRQLEAADRHTRAGQNMEAAAIRGQAIALQDALQRELKAVRLCKQHLTELNTKMEDAKQELCLADKRMTQVTTSAAAVLNVTEYVHRACELRYECGERQWGILQILRQAADATERAGIAQRELKASEEAEKQLTQAGKRGNGMSVARAITVLKRSSLEAEAEHRLSDARSVQEANACVSVMVAARLYMELAERSGKLLRNIDQMKVHQAEHEQLGTSLEDVRRSHQAANTLLLHRRSEMQNLTGQIEAHMCEGQLLCKIGNKAQAVVRQEAATMLTSQLAEIAEDVMKLERRCSYLQQKQTVLSSLLAKSESRKALTSQLARLCSAAVEHLLDARDAHDKHSAHIREAAVAAVELSKEEAVLSAANARVRELRESLEQLTRDKEAAEGCKLDDDEGEDHDKLQQEINLVQAELVSAHRLRVEVEQQVLAIRARVAQAELAEQSSQLRITKARQRAEDVQQLMDNIRVLLNGSSALVINVQDAVGTAADALQDRVSRQSSSVDAPANGRIDTSSPHGILAAAQLHSVILQAITEAASNYIWALECAAAAEQRRGEALLSAQAAQVVREAVGRQHAATEELNAVVEGIKIMRQVHQLMGGCKRRRNDVTAYDSRGHNTGSREQNAGGQGPPYLSMSPQAASIEQDTAAISELELERLQHEAAYKEADGAQGRKLVACFLQHQKLLRIASKSLLEIARFGIAADLNAGPNMTADEASSLLAACKQLAEQHATTLMLRPALDRCKHAEEYLKASLDYIHEAKKLRDRAIDNRLSVLRDHMESKRRESDPAQRRVLIANISRSSNRENSSATGERETPEFDALSQDPAEDEEPNKAAQLVEYNLLLLAEERKLAQVQELDEAVSTLLEESNATAVLFTRHWADVRRLVSAATKSPCALLSEDLAVNPTVGFKDASSENEYRGSQLCTARDGTMALVPISVPASSMDIRINKSNQISAAYTNPEECGRELSLRLMPPIAGLEEESSQGTTGDICTQSVANAGTGPQSIPVVRPQADFAMRHSGGPPEPNPHRRGNGHCKIDAELVEMAAATVTRAKAAAAALALKAFSALDGGHLLKQQQPEAAPCVASEPDKNGEVDMNQHMKPLLLSKSAQTKCAASGQPCTTRLRGPAITHDMRGSIYAAAAGALGSEAPGYNFAWPAQCGGSSQVTISSSLPIPQVGNGVGTCLGHPFTSAGNARIHHVPGPKTTALIGRPINKIPADDLPTACLFPVGPQHSNTPRLAAGLAAISQGPGNHADMPQLPRVPLPHDLDPVAAATLLGLWSMAALYYQRAQQMHDCSLRQAERQLEKSQAQVDILQAEELKTRSGGRLCEANVVKDTVVKWQQRTGQLNIAMQRHRQEFFRHQALAHRAMTMVEQLQLRAAAASTDSGSAVAATAMAQSDDILQKLLPRLPEITLTGCGIIQPLERLRDELVQHVAALHATAVGLQQQSQRLFDKASRCSNKCKVQMGTTESTAAYALTLAKSQSAADESAAHGEHAVELANHARMVHELAERLSGESVNCLHILECLQYACDQELQAQEMLVQAADLLLCEAMQAVLRGEWGAGLGLEAISWLQPNNATSSEALVHVASQTGDVDSLLQARHPPGVSLSSARFLARRGEDMAQDAARTVQRAKEQLELRIGPFVCQMDDVAAALARIASAWSSHCDALQTQVSCSSSTVW
ncbi:hypothetical protein Vafri_19197 [Volvox africanus]|uniref:Uncharacterized protein n=1 Tax=Volvox africanus TaxID=51714 RepID=A0A8J4F8I1_9CHLO|nr:hypothetical protein Vafri_19197 [Volvox africanus]